MPSTSSVPRLLGESRPRHEQAGRRGATEVVDLTDDNDVTHDPMDTEVNMNVTNNGAYNRAQARSSSHGVRRERTQGPRLAESQGRARNSDPASVINLATSPDQRAQGNIARSAHQIRALADEMELEAAEMGLEEIDEDEIQIVSWETRERAESSTPVLPVTRRNYFPGIRDAMGFANNRQEAERRPRARRIPRV